jgi:hypothetical protein
MERMVESISSEEGKREFLAAYFRLLIHEGKKHVASQGRLPDMLTLQKSLHGLTVEEIIDRANALPPNPKVEKEVAKRAEQFLARVAAYETRRNAKRKIAENNPKLQADLQNLGKAYHGYLDAHHKKLAALDKSRAEYEVAPQNWEDMERFVQAQMPQTLESIRRLRGQGVRVAWGIDFIEARIGTSNFLLAHKPDAPQKGGLILFLDASVSYQNAARIQDLLEQRKTCWTPPEPILGTPWDTPLIGGDGGQEFRLVGESDQPVVGVRYTLRQQDGEQAISRLDPLFERDAAAGKERIVARPGYALAGFNVDAGKYVNALQIIFMRQNADGSLDPSDQYTSDWFGNHRRKNTRQLGCTGAKVLGFQGRGGSVVLNAVGLVILANEHSLKALRSKLRSSHPADEPAEVAEPAEPTTPDALASSQSPKEEPSGPQPPVEMAAAQPVSPAEEGSFLTDDAPVAPPQMRTWSSANGKFQVEAKMIGARDGQVTIRDESGKTIAVPLERLSAADRAYVAARASARHRAADPPRGGTPN